MSYPSLEACLLDLEKAGHLVRIKEEVDPNLEMAAIHLRVYEMGGPAILYENVKNKSTVIDWGLTEEISSELKESLKLVDENKTNYLKSHNISLKRKIWIRKHGGGLWDADHIIPVKDGGGMCGLDNLRTLCISCHKKITFVKKIIV